MRAVVYHGARDLRVETVDDASVVSPTDAVVRVTHAAICGSDLWFYRGISPYEPGRRVGHEFIGVVEDTGSEVPNLRRGDRVMASMVIADGSCDYCRDELPTNCRQGAFFGWPGIDGGQGEAVRVPQAGGTLFRLPDGLPDDDPLLERILPLTDVMSTGQHAAMLSEVAAGSAVAVIGDGAVGLCAVRAASRLGADRIVLMGAHPDRLELGRRFGATDVVRARGTEGREAVFEIAPDGVHSVMECVGTQESLDTAVAIARPGGHVGMVGAPHTDGRIDIGRIFRHNIGVRAGITPVQRYLADLLHSVLNGSLDVSPIFTSSVALADVVAGYEGMDSRRDIKVLIRI
ncbi:MAG TPA: alcohol dehydrogenase catalytic domain-containing protein [Trebonia sp.]|nr:alcohol dehydrogenase catalytic domain-containing protein [Trebonia sp.]